MKTHTKSTWLFAIILMLSNFAGLAQNNVAPSKVKPTLTVLNLDTKGINLDPAQMGSIVRIELDKLGMYEVTDRYDVAYLIEKNKLNITGCYGKTCLLEIGKTIHSDYMFTGSAELFGQTIVITYREINVATESVDRTYVMEFLNLPLEIQTMASMALRKMYNKPVDAAEEERLTKKFHFETAVNNPNRERVNLTGPRFGYTFIFGENADIMRKPTNEGGFDAYPALFQFGYQFEWQYLNEGHYQALFEMIPVVSGLDQQMFIPSVTLLNGFRNNRNGWEFAIGPSFSLSTYSQMANINGTYYDAHELEVMGVQDAEMHKTLNSNGDIGIGTSLIFGVGKTFKSGKMNIPVNLFASFPSNQGFRVGISVGYNSKNNSSR